MKKLYSNLKILSVRDYNLMKGGNWISGFDGNLYDNRKERRKARRSLDG